MQQKRSICRADRSPVSRPVLPLTRRLPPRPETGELAYRQLRSIEDIGFRALSSSQRERWEVRYFWSSLKMNTCRRAQRRVAFSSLITVETKMLPYCAIFDQRFILVVHCYTCRRLLKTQCGTANYAAPEVLTHRRKRSYREVIQKTIERGFFERDREVVSRDR